MEEKKFNNSNFHKFFWCPLSPILAIIFVPGHRLKKIIFPQSLSVFLSSKKSFKETRQNSAYRYLFEISFVPRRGNGPLGIKDAHPLTQFDSIILIGKGCHVFTGNMRNKVMPLINFTICKVEISLHGLKSHVFLS